jgi:predicted HAD superfamily Cof-like phosphohydrolase
MNDPLNAPMPALNLDDICFTFSFPPCYPYLGHVTVMHHPNMIQDVTDFMLAMGQSRQVLSSPEIPDPDTQLLRSKLNREEFGELDLGWCRCQELYIQMQQHLVSDGPVSLDEIANAQIDALTEVADGIGDLIYVLLGMANAYGIPMVKVWNEIQRANMAKLWTVEEAYGPTKECPLGQANENGWKAEKVEIRTDDPNEMRLRYAIRRPDGKVAKPPSFTPPNIRQIIVDAINDARTLRHEAMENSGEASVGR